MKNWVYEPDDRGDDRWICQRCGFEACAIWEAEKHGKEKHGCTKHATPGYAVRVEDCPECRREEATS